MAMRAYRLRCCITLAIAGVLAQTLSFAGNAAEPVQVLAAFILKSALDEIAADYRKTGGEVTLVYGPSPGLAQQVENGAPGDSADPMWVDELRKHHFIKAGTLADLIGNHLVLIAKKGSPPVNLKSLPQSVGTGPIAMCDPESHPAGRMAKASLTSLGLWDQVEKWVAIAENPLLAVKMVARGDAPYGIVFTADAMTDPGVAIAATFPDDSHPPIRYPVAILAKSSNPEAPRFLGYLKPAPATETFGRLGYEIPRAK